MRMALRGKPRKTPDRHRQGAVNLRPELGFSLAVQKKKPRRLCCGALHVVLASARFCDAAAVGDDLFGDEIAEGGHALGLAQLFGIGEEDRNLARFYLR